MKIFVTSDTHFCHKAIIEYEDRPFKSVEAMNEALINNWNKVVGKNDLIYHLGDFGLGKIKDLQSIYQRLNGNKVLLRGNHDPSLPKCFEIGFPVVCDTIAFKYKYWEVMLHHFNDFPGFEYADEDVVLIHGHIHGKQRRINSMLHAGTDAWDYTPVCIDALFRCVQDEKIIVRDYEDRAY